MAAAFECDRCGRFYKSNQVEMKGKSGNTYYRTIWVTIELASPCGAEPTKTLDLCPHCQDVIYRCTGHYEEPKTLEGDDLHER